MAIKKLGIEEIKNLYNEEKLNIAEIAKKIGISFWSLYNFMNKHNIMRRLPSEVNYIVNKNKPKFEIKGNLNPEEEKLKIAGIMLYWAEGTLKNNTVDFVNSNPYIIKIFLRFLREICNVSEQRPKLYLYAYSNHDLNKLKLYWHEITNIPLSQFTKPYIKKNISNLTDHKLLYGLVHVRYNDKKLLSLISNWIDEYINWAGTQAAKGGRLCKSSVLLKGKMEK